MKLRFGIPDNSPSSFTCLPTDDTSFGIEKSVGKFPPLEKSHSLAIFWRNGDPSINAPGSSLIHRHLPCPVSVADSSMKPKSTTWADAQSMKLRSIFSC